MQRIMATIKVTKEVCKKCLWGYPCEMWDDIGLPMEGELCDNFDDKTKWRL